MSKPKMSSDKDRDTRNPTMENDRNAGKSTQDKKVKQVSQSKKSDIVGLKANNPKGRKNDTKKDSSVEDDGRLWL